MASPKLVAVQEWHGSKRVRAWTPDGRRPKATIVVDHGDDMFPLKSPAIELIATVPCAENEPFPTSFWRIRHGMKGYYMSDGWKDHKTEGPAAFSLVGSAKGSEASVDLFLASGPRHPISPKATLQLGKWVQFGNRFSARVSNRSYINDLRHRIVQAILEIRVPKKYRDWDVEPDLHSGGHGLTPLGLSGRGAVRSIKFESPVDRISTLTFMGRPYIRHRFDGIALQPHYFAK